MKPVSLSDMPGLALRPVVRQRRFATPRSIMALILREMSTTYGRNPGGYLWALLEPVAGIALLTIVFSIAFRAPSLGVNFPIFYATGMVPFMLYMDVSAKLSAVIPFSRALLSYPSVTLMDALIARFFLNLLVQLLVAYVIFTGILTFFETRTSPDFPAIALALLMAAAFAAGIGVFNCFLMGLYPVWRRIWAIVNRPLFLVSCIFFLFDSIPEPYATYLWFNPLVHIVGQMRHGFYPYYDALYVSPAYVFGVSLMLTALGFVFLARYTRDILHS